MSAYPTCLAGAGRACITPDVPCSLAGYFHQRIANRVRDDLYATCMAFERDGRRLVLIGCDLIAMTDAISDAVSARLADEFGVAPDDILMTASHTHTGPEIRSSGVPKCTDYAERLPERIAEAARQALSNLFPATVHVGHAEAPGVSFNRLNRLASGKEVFGHPAGERIVGPAGPVDASVLTLGVYDEHKRLRALAVNFGCHPDVIGGGSADFVSADWPGVMAGAVSAVYGGDVPCLFLQGAAGDINHREGRERFVPAEGELRSIHMGRALAGAAVLANEAAEPMADLTLDSRAQTLDVPFYTRTPEFMAYIAELKAKGADATYFEQNLIKRAEQWAFDGQSDQFRVRCLRIGEAAVVAMPGEIFTAWGLETKRYSPARHTLFVELASAPNGRAGYKCTTDQGLRGADGRGAYGALPTLSMRHCVDAGRHMTEAAIRLACELFPE